LSVKEERERSDVFGGEAENEREAKPISLDEVHVLEGEVAPPAVHYM
jgi:hypothetical protein